MGNQRVINIPFRNAGGPGCFRIIPDALWPLTPDDDADSLDMDVASVGPFRIWPLFLNMAAGEESNLGVSFSPEVMGSHQERLIIVCDNCQVSRFKKQRTFTSLYPLLHSSSVCPFRLYLNINLIYQYVAHEVAHHCLRQLSDEAEQRRR